jgi:DNA-binding response OmpR family regulator
MDSHNGVKVLVADDDPDLAQVLSMILRNAGYRVHTAHSASEALQYAQQHPVRAAILDIHLPDLHGLILSQRLREVCGPNVPILVLSGDSSIGVINSLPLAGVTYFFCKPVNARQLVDRLAELLRAAGNAVTSACGEKTTH